MREFAEERVAPVAEELDREHRFPYELVAEMAELGLMGMTIPEEYGGGGTDTLSYAIAVEELTRIDSSVAITVAAHHSLGTLPIWLFGTEEQKQEWLPELASGQKLAAFGLTEPDAGSDAGATRTRAELARRRVGGQRVEDLHHERRHRHHRLRHDHRPSPARDEISNLIVANGTPGYEISPPMQKLGWRASDTRELSFRDCARARGEPARRRAARASSSSSRSSTAAASRSPRWGSASRRARTTSPCAYATGAQAVRQADLEFQAVQFKLADMATEIEAGRGLVYRAAWLKDQGRDFAQAAAMAKLYTGELSHRVANDGAADPRRLRLHGGVRRSRGSTATRRSSRSARARTRCSAW